MNKRPLFSELMRSFGLRGADNQAKGKLGIDLTAKTVVCRVKIAQYVSLDQGHRTTLVVGMIDAMEAIAKLLDARALNSGDLRKTFDDWVQSRSAAVDQERTAIANPFLSMLIAATGTL
jgi:hypothetical protein